MSDYKKVIEPSPDELAKWQHLTTISQLEDRNAMALQRTNIIRTYNKTNKRIMQLTFTDGTLIFPEAHVHYLKKLIK